MGVLSEKKKIPHPRKKERNLFYWLTAMAVFVLRLLFS
ncbi:hypothetical protein NBRC111894_2925 [Sporolactobacillus inulinus]|uniref:Uncharacterized protein n=1 Tax=Sporolactobacillus inulinus TaxID=2078 RepID=A0A4Y1ZEJ1_9BACL|nr:hypothetical protein NBRC111894_2925 [Sporolactobacillus inulinus]